MFNLFFLTISSCMSWICSSGWTILLPPTPPPCRFYADLYSEEDIIAIVDDDCLFVTPVTPEVWYLGSRV